MFSTYSILFMTCAFLIIVFIYLTGLFAYSWKVNYKGDGIKAIIFGILTVVAVVGVIHSVHYGLNITKTTLEQKVQNGYKVYANGVEVQLDTVNLSGYFITVTDENQKIILTSRYR